MSRDYYFFCLTCMQCLHMGKVTKTPFPDGTSPPEYHFSGVFLHESVWHNGDEVFGLVMEKFLIIHRNHLLTFAPAEIDEYLAEIFGTIQVVEAEDILAANIDPEVDWSSELQSWIRRIVHWKQNTRITTRFFGSGSTGTEAIDEGK